MGWFGDFELGFCGFFLVVVGGWGLFLGVVGGWWFGRS